MVELFIGVDGGGSGTKLVCIDGSGKVLSEAQSGATNWNGVGKQQAKKNLTSGIQQLLKFKHKDDIVKRVCLSMSGVHTPDDKLTYHSWTIDIPEIAGAGVIVCNDVYAALASGTEGLVQGIVCIAGTGMNCFGKHPISKDEWHAGGMGPFLGDVGSGYYIGEGVLGAAARQADGRETRSTALFEALKVKFGWKVFEDAIHYRYEQWGQKEVAALAPICFEYAERNDPVAVDIRLRSAQGLAECFTVVLKKLWNGENAKAQPVNLVCAGSVWQNNAYREMVIDLVRKNVSPIEIKAIVPTVEPMMGSAWIALKTSENDIEFRVPEVKASSTKTIRAIAACTAAVVVVGTAAWELSKRRKS
jgi:N-acetylglucosamine kinase-like BadF-type ATPase